MAATSRVAAVTGGNKGIGLAIVRNLALQYPSSSLKAGPFLIYLTARSPERGAEAVKALNSDPQLKQAKVLAEDGGDTTIKYHELDVSQTKSIQDFRDFLKQQHPEGIDVVVNNAGVALDGYDATIVKRTLETNYYGALEVTQDLLPLIRQGGRLVNVSSQVGLLTNHAIRDSYIAASKKDVPAVTALMTRFQQAAHDGTEREQGYPTSAYAVSKAGMTAFTKAIAAKESRNGSSVLINACCPGFVKTDMTKQRGFNSSDQGAKTPVLLALGDVKGTTGEFWLREQVSGW